MKRRRILLAGIAFFGLIVLLGGRGLWKATAVVRSALLLDNIITPELTRSGCAAEVPFDFRVSSDGLKRLYEAKFDLGQHAPEVFAVCTIAVAPAGSLLSRREYDRAKKHYATLDEEHPDPDFRWAEVMFPDVGRRAILSCALGPSGGGDSIIFTTSDGRFDISVSQGNRLIEGVQAPGVDCQKIARSFCELYDGSEEQSTRGVHEISFPKSQWARRTPMFDATLRDVTPRLRCSQTCKDGAGPRAALKAGRAFA